MSNDLVLQQFQREQRITYALLSVALALLAFALPFVDGGFVYPMLTIFPAVMGFVWMYHWMTGRRIRNGTFAASTSILSKIEQADLYRWIEHGGGTRIRDVHLD